MKSKKNIKDLLGQWKDPNTKNNFYNDHQHIKDKSLIVGLKYLDRNAYIKQKWHILHTYTPEIILNEKDLKILDIGPGAGNILEVCEFYGHEAIGMDRNDKYRAMINSQKLNLYIHNANDLPWPFEDEHFDYVYSWASITYLDTNQVNEVFDEIERVSKLGIMVGVDGKNNFFKNAMKKWKSKKFKLEILSGNIYKWSLK